VPGRQQKFDIYGGRPPTKLRFVSGYIKGKSAIHLARTYGERKRNFAGQHFWPEGTSSRP
jgi:hypothetical protein